MRLLHYKPCFNQVFYLFLSSLFPGHRRVHVLLHGVRLLLPNGVRPGQRGAGRRARGGEKAPGLSDAAPAKPEGIHFTCFHL